MMKRPTIPREIHAPSEMISVIIPVYNEDESLAALFDELTAALQDQPWAYELIFVNDGSTDRTGEILDVMAKDDPAVLVIHFRRNYGQTAAMSAGIDHSSGDVIVPIDGDLQNDPADIPRLVATLSEGYDVVSGWRKHRRDRAITRTIPSRCANWLISQISGVGLHDYGCTLKAYRRDVVAGVRLYGEMHRFVPIYAHMQGGAITEVVVNHRPRQFGASKYGLSRVYKVVLDLMLVKFLASYASKPMYVFGGFGLLCLLMSIIPFGLAIWFKFTAIAGMQKDFVETPLPVVTAVTVLVGFLAILQGLLAEVLMRTYFESQGKRTYQVRQRSRMAGEAAEMTNVEIRMTNQ
ncbi:MAG: glycosyltransferase [Planctomycetaceae bacterium]